MKSNLSMNTKAETGDEKIKTILVLKNNVLSVDGDHVYQAYTAISGTNKVLKIKDDELDINMCVRSSEIVAAYTKP